MTNTSQLDSYGRYLFGGKYKGTFAIDQIPKLTKTQPYAIINNKGASDGGEHWLGLVKDKDRYIIFDTFGRNLKKLLPTFITPKLKYIGTDKDPDQSITDRDCGSRVMSWIMLYDKYGPKVSQLL